MGDKHPYDEPDLNLEEGTDLENQDGSREPKEDAPVHLSKIKSGFVFVAFLVIVMIVIMTIRSCSVSRQVNSSQDSQIAETQVNQENNTITSTGENDIKNLDNLAEKEGSDSSWNDTANEANSAYAEGDTSTNSNDSVSEETTESSVNKEDTVSSDITLQKVSEPQLSESIKVQAVVSSKSIFLSDSGSYVYEVDFLVLTDDNGEYSTFSYFCPKTTYDALTKGDSVNVEYQVDSSGNVSVGAVTR